ncbi:hypothetical protein CCACVL1_03848 [Corchorus capsularis]|uniref:Uncharacterized protein n=1 Tax=Corchorus capsularis TaxID=210143 RepID=A0A1R3JWU8_COCAP|nr:hypothetical protein CCACVL1_03848 [Corchorus capsularis]
MTTLDLDYSEVELCRIPYEGELSQHLFSPFTKLESKTLA